MRTKLGVCAALCLALVAGSALMSNTFAHATKMQKTGKTTNLEGKVGKVDKDTITVLVGNSPKPVMVNSDTKFLMGHTTDNKPGSVSEIKQGNYISCTVNTDDKGNLVAKQCLYRDKP